MQFKHIYGHEQIKNLLLHNAHQSHNPHAIYLAGIPGIGKLHLAIAYLQYLNCNNPTQNDSCGTCPNCQMFNQFAHPNLHFIYPIIKQDNNKTTTSLDYFDTFQKMLIEQNFFDLNDWINYLNTENKQVRIFENETSTIAQIISTPPFNNGFKGIIIWQPDKMNETFANKILKMLEEPPNKTIFILVGENPQLLLPTIQSRTQIIHIPPLTQPQMETFLQSHYPNLQNPNNIAKLAKGSILQAIRLTTQNEQNNILFSYFTTLMRNAWLVANKKNYNALLQLKKWSLEIAENKNGREFQKSFLQFAQNQIRENLIFNLHEPQLNYQTQQEQNFSTNFAPFINIHNAQRLMGELDRAETQITQNGNPKIIFFDLALQTIVLFKNT